MGGCERLVHRSLGGLPAIALIVATSGCAALSMSREPTYASVRQLIESRRIQSIPSLLADLPDSYLAHHALVFESRSPQGASLHDPRAIVYGADASFVVAFNGSPTQRGFSSLDTMEFDRRSDRFVLREITFLEGTQPRFSEDNPPACLACHGNPPRPIWDAYPTWPGAYGEQAGATVSEREGRGLEAFETDQVGNPRYGRLIDRPLRAGELRALAYDGGQQSPPNAELGVQLGHWNAEAVVHDVMASPRIADYRYALLASLVRACAGVETIPSPVDARFRETYDRFTADAHRAYERQQELKALRASSSAASGVRTDPFALSRFRYVAELGMGLTTETWSTAFERGAFEPPASDFDSIFVERLATRDPQLRRLFEAASQGDCRDLQRRSIDQLRQSSPLRAGEAEGAAASGEPVGRESRGRSVPVLLDLCVGCHDHGPGPGIPFTDRNALLLANRKARPPRGSLLADIAWRLGPAAGARRMPLGVDLSKEEAASLGVYFRRAMREDGLVGDGSR